MYQDALEENLISSVKKLNLIKGQTFQQDNDPKHTAKITQDWFLKKQGEGAYVAQPIQFMEDSETMSQLANRNGLKLNYNAAKSLYQSCKAVTAVQQNTNVIYL